MLIQTAAHTRSCVDVSRDSGVAPPLVESRVRTSPGRMFTRSLSRVVLLTGLAACGDDPVATDTTTGGTSTGTTGDPPTGPTTDALTSTSTGTTADPQPTTTTDGVSASTTTSTTGDTTTTGNTTTTGDTTTDDSTTGEPFVCIEPTDSDTAADPGGWTRVHGEPKKYLSVRHLVIAPDGGVVIATLFNGVIDLGDGPIDTGGNNHIVLARYGAGGEFEWSTHIGGENGNISPLAIAVDCGGNLVIGGAFDTDIATQGKVLKVVPGFDLQVDILYPTSDMFLAQYSAAGKLRWARRFGDDTWQRIHDLDLQADGTIVIGGATQGTLELGGAPIVAGSSFDGVVAAFDPDGGLLWQRSDSAASDVAVEQLAVGPGGRISAYGHAGDAVDLGGGELPNDGIYKWVAQFEPDGAHRWSRRFLDAKHDVLHSGADAGGGLVLAGDYYPGNNVQDAFLVRYDDTGALAWTRNFNAEPMAMESFDLGALAVGAEVTIAGSLLGGFDFGGGPQDSPVATAYVARYDLAGASLDTTLFPGTLYTRPRASAYGPDGELVLGGQFQLSMDLGDGPKIAVGNNDLFVHRFGD